jgi:hypothetical protein
MTQSNARHVTGIILLLAVLAMLVHGPIVQFDHYHEFADARVWLGMADPGDVLSNLVFALSGIYGLWAVLRPNARMQSSSGVAYACFFAAMLLTAAGSTWYHLAPADDRLIWDRLPIALACAALLVAVWAETLTRSAQAALPMLVRMLGAAALSVVWWVWTNEHGRGDLRPYLLLQLAPLVLIPIWQAAAGRPAIERRAFALAIALYVAAKLCELEDRLILHALGFVSGHTLKHLLAAAAAGVLAAMLRARSGLIAEATRRSLRLPSSA